MIDRINGRLALLLAIAGLLVLVLAGWFMLVSPPAVEGRGTRHSDRRREHPARGDAGVPAQPGGAPERRGPPPPSRRASRRRGDVRDPPAARVGVPRERRQDREHHAVGARSVTGAQAVPIALSVKGRYFRLAKFEHLLRIQARVKDGKVRASGRLYAIDNVSFSNGDKGGVITATLALNAFVHGSAPAPAPGSTTGATSTTTDDARRWPRRQQSGAERSANTARIAAKQRRQKILVVVLAVVLVALLAYEVPHLLSAAEQLVGGACRSGRIVRDAHGAAATAVPRVAGAAPTPSPSSRCRTATLAPRPPAGPIRSRVRRPRAAVVARRPAAAPEADRDRPTRRSQGREARLDRHPRLDPDEQRARRGRRASRAARAATSARSRSSTRRIAARCAAATGSSTPARTRRWRRSRDAQATSTRAGYRDGLHPRTDRVPVRRLKTRLRAEEGMTLIELLIAMVVMSIGIAALVAGFSSGILAVNRARADVDGRHARGQADGALPPGGVHLAHAGSAQRRAADRLGRAHVLGRHDHQLDLRRRPAEHDDDARAADVPRHARRAGR